MVQPRLLAILSEQLYYDEIAIPFTRMQNECKQLIALLADCNIDLRDRLDCSVFTIDQANELVSHNNTLHFKVNCYYVYTQIYFNYFTKIISDI